MLRQLMKPGDLVKNKKYPEEMGLFMGMRTFKRKASNGSVGSAYTCAEVMWFERNAPNGDRISTIQKDLIEVISE